MIGIIDYGVGNIKAFSNIYKMLNIPCVVVNSVDQLRLVTKIILPGVGHFDYAMSKFINSGMSETIEKLVLIDKTPVLGVCVGMQMMASQSEEGSLPGLGWINGSVKRFQFNDYPLPHMGWNNFNFRNNDSIFSMLDDNAQFYFLHSYYFSCDCSDSELGSTHYGHDFSSAVKSDNVYGVQFHPEKSHGYGIQVLKNFANLC